MSSMATMAISLLWPIGQYGHSGDNAHGELYGFLKKRLDLSNAAPGSNFAQQIYINEIRILFCFINSENPIYILVKNGA